VQTLHTATASLGVYLFKRCNYLKLVEGKTEVILYNKFSITVKALKLTHLLTACCNEHRLQQTMS
jgi:hypothetical protein